jgi:hypothetical protein
MADLAPKLSALWNDKTDRARVSRMLSSLDARYSLRAKIAAEPGVADIAAQMLGRLARAYPDLASLQHQKILDIACGSNSSKAPASLRIDTPFGEVRVGRAGKGYTAQFEPWFCRMLLDLGADPVGVDFGDLEHEVFVHHTVDLGKIGALDFLPDHSFDAVQDSRLFGSPEFTAQLPKKADRLNVAREIRRQEQRLLKTNGTVIHSDARALLEN